jgi:ElaB/YqjD/DUF883 family membrane-anchored ribosome-binding protein
LKKVVKTAISYRDYNDSKDEDYTHVIYKKDDYITNVHVKIRDLNEKISFLERDYKARISHYEQSANDKIAEIRAQADGRVAQARAEMQEHKQRADSFENINKNLIRVAVEKANAKRELTPKKQHTGYIFLSIEEYIFNCDCFISEDSKKTKILKFPCFRIRLQSPYDVSLELKAAQDLIFEDLLNNIMDKMNVNSVFKDGINGTTEDEVKKIWKEKEAFIFRLFYKANFQKGFWEVEFFARDMPIILPEMIQNRGENYEKILPADKARKTE